MTIQIGQVALYSKDKANLASFLSDILEAEILPTGDAVRLVHENFTIIILDGSEVQGPATPNDIVVDFFVESLSELEDLKQNAEFFQYRYNSSQSSQNPSENVEIQSIGPFHFFYLRDTDNRKWKFSFRDL